MKGKVKKMSLYNSPRLYDQSKTIVESFSVNESKRHFLLIADQDGIEKVRGFLPSLSQDTYHFYSVGDTECALALNTTPISQQDFEMKRSEILSKQKVGTQLYIAGKWKFAEKIFTEAVASGFSEEEIQVCIQGPKERYTYCPSCYTLSAIHPEDVESQCPKCGVMLVISKHYSRVRKGYLGYPYVKQ